jgi:hypothetical protein
MTATQFGLGLLYIAVAVVWYAAGWWQGRTVQRDRWEEQDQLVQRDLSEAHIHGSVIVVVGYARDVMAWRGVPFAVGGSPLAPELAVPAEELAEGIDGVGVAVAHG